MGNCPIHEGSHPKGVIVARSRCPKGELPLMVVGRGEVDLRGDCPLDSCPRGRPSCPRSSC